MGAPRLEAERQLIFRPQPDVAQAVAKIVMLESAVTRCERPNRLGCNPGILMWPSKLRIVVELRL